MIRTQAAVNGASKLLSEGKLEAAERKLAEARRLILEFPTSAKTREGLGYTYLIEADLRLSQGRMEDVLEAFAKAEDVLSQDPSNREVLGRCLRESAITLADIGFVPLSLKYLDRAEAALGGPGDPAAGEVARLRRKFEAKPGVLSDAAPEDELADVDDEMAALRAEIESSFDPAQRAMSSFNLAVILLGKYGPLQMQEASALLKTTFDYCMKRREIDKLAKVLWPLCMHRDLPWPSWLGPATETAVKLVRKKGGPGQIANILYARASWLHIQGDAEAALALTLESLAYGDEDRRTTASSLVRMLTANASEGARELALEIAVGRHDVELVVELLESARLQVLPRPLARRSDRYAGDSVIGTVATVAATDTTDTGRIEVAGGSRVRQTSKSWDTGPLIDLDRCLSLVGGPDAVWWGCWAFEERLYWAVYGSGVSSTGVMSISPGTRLRALFDILEQCCPSNGALTPEQLLDGAYCRSASSEEQLSRDFGEAFIPKPLKDLMLRAAEQNADPLSLVLSGSPFALLPLPLLGVGEVPRRGLIRLVEAACIRIFPPAVLVEHVAHHRAVTRWPLPLSLACVDPTGDLPYSRRVPAAAEVVLAGPSGVEGDTDIDYSPATAAALAAALQHLGPTHGSVMVYAGHGYNGNLSGDSESGLVLRDGQGLPAETIFTPKPDGTPGIPFPARVLLGACDSSGSGGAGAGEWFGTTAAVLWAGARSVTATNWNVWDHPFTSWFDAELAQQLRVEQDAARALRNVQLASLHAWRDGVLPSSMRFTRAAHPHECYPVIWGAYCSIGVL
ncbi:CHAT domain-containing protein [Amycolatopsis sp. NBC_01307]|uniref:CHAT domain-containing protein n=1 Tax=Amycolatopsis sp. NBC_01307 TaxID=2903561 RepID=UPI002E1489D6|nr:CHAT domain-containing protein [Amycolatopsis sp. NBC_01307]